MLVAAAFPAAVLVIEEVGLLPWPVVEVLVERSVVTRPAIEPPHAVHLTALLRSQPGAAVASLDEEVRVAAWGVRALVDMLPARAEKVLLVRTSGGRAQLPGRAAPPRPSARAQCRKV